MEQLPGFVAQGEIERVCCLRKFLYGLKQVHVRGLVNSAKLLRNSFLQFFLLDFYIYQTHTLHNENQTFFYFQIVKETIISNT